MEQIVITSLATLLLAFGHTLRTIRWSRIVSFYERTNYGSLFYATGFGYLVDFLSPLRIGDFFRAIIAGKKMKNGMVFGVATVIVDRCIDLVCVSLIFWILFLIGGKFNGISENLLLYGCISLVIISFAVLSIVARKFLKNIILKLASIFNNNIELQILRIAFGMILSSKKAFAKKKQIVLLTVSSWSAYVVSYVLFANAMNAKFELVFGVLFNQSNVMSGSSSFLRYLNDWYLIMAFFVIPILVLFIAGFLTYQEKVTSDQVDVLLPQLNDRDRLAFLKLYFDGEKRSFAKNYLNINKDIYVLKDNSAGSDATTLLCMGIDGQRFFRKYAFGGSGSKLNDQIKWLKKYEKQLPLTKISQSFFKNEICYYDMPIKDSKMVGFFDFIHQHNVQKNGKILESVLMDLEKNLYFKTIVQPKNKKHLIKKYIADKVAKNLRIINETDYVKKLSRYDEIIVNGTSYKNLNFYKKYLDQDFLEEAFRNDPISEIHGDLTIENIIAGDDAYYLIDPNTGNVHNSKYLDYAKILQSLHGNYEFLMKTFMIEYYDNKINFLNSRSANYEEMYQFYKQYLTKHFNKEQILSIYLHEVIHWLRLMPYKMKKDEKRSRIFYAGMLIVLDSVYKEFIMGTRYE